jgi:hypothetical protein
MEDIKMQELNSQEVDLVVGAGGMSVADIGYTVGYAVGSAYQGITSTGYQLGLLIYDWTH